MNNNNDLYFIPILIKAFESVNPLEAMENAMLEIEELGDLEDYREGYAQFRQFVSACIEKETKDSIASVDKVLLGVATQSLGLPKEEYSELINKIRTNPKLYKKYESIIQEVGTHAHLEIEIYKDKTLLDSSIIQTDNKELTFLNIESGYYLIQLSNGRILWEGELKNNDITLDLTRSEIDYNLAAETEETKAQPTRIFELIKDEIKLEIYAGLEFGKFKIIIK